MKRQYRIGHANIQIEMPDEMLFPKNLRLFETCTEDIETFYQLSFAEDLLDVEQRFRTENEGIKEYKRPNMRILVTPNRECRIINFEGMMTPYAVSVEEDISFTRVWISRDVQGLLDVDTIFISVLGLEKVMLKNQSLILHSAYMLKNGKAVLFSAPSGTGKSTQAGLWEKYRGTRQINGDKSLLIREEKEWYAYGWPICGSSEICYNEAYPIQAIVMLHQAKENSVRQLSIGEAMKKVMSQITINMWNTTFQIHAMDLIQQLVTEVPVYELGCDISEEAVACLEQVL